MSTVWVPVHYRCAGVCLCVLMTPQVYVESYSASLKNVYSLRNLKWFLVHKRFTKYKTGLAHGCNPWQSLPDLCLWGRCVQKKSCKEDKGQLKGKIRKLKKNKLRLFALILSEEWYSPWTWSLARFFQSDSSDMLCPPSLEIFVTNCSPDKIQDPDMQNETKKMDMVGWWFPAVNLGATWKS